MTDRSKHLEKLADAVHEFDCKLGIQIFHPEYDVEALAELFRKGDMEGGRAKMRHDMVHFIQESDGRAVEQYFG